MINHYQILGAHPEMFDHEIRTLYRALARKHHPDKGGDSDAFAAVTAAYAAVGTAKARASLRGLYALHAPACNQCGGCGYTQRSKGFTSVVRTVCDACHGAGYLLEQAASPRSYRKKR